MKLDPSAKYVLDRLRGAGFPAWAVGGCVRDSLLGAEPADWDVCTAALPEQTAALFERVARTGEKHGTVTALLDRPIEITTLRTEGAYLDRRRPSGVSFTGDIRADLARRDFTINAMAWSPEDGLVDPFGGRDDLAAGVLRCVGDPKERFSEDALRILRALRFISRLGFEAEPETDRAIRECAPYLKEISVERVYSELLGVLRGKHVDAALLGYPEVVTAAVPELAPTVGFAQHSPHHIYDVWEHTVRAVAAAPEDEAAVRLTLLLHDMGKPSKYRMDETGRGRFRGHGAAGAEMAEACLRRLKTDRETREEVTTLVKIHDEPLPDTEAGMRRLLAKLGERQVRMLIEVKRADGSARAPASAESRLQRLSEGEALLERVLAQKPPLTAAELRIGGAELMELGVPSGPEMGRILEALLGETLDGTLKNERGPLLARARELINE
jgi:tRNA nucleotidyltransferase (CCA-adding enzyme)